MGFLDETWLASCLPKYPKTQYLKSGKEFASERYRSNGALRCKSIRLDFPMSNPYTYQVCRFFGASLCSYESLETRASSWAYSSSSLAECQIRRQISHDISNPLRRLHVNILRPMSLHGIIYILLDASRLLDDALLFLGP